MPDPTLPPHDQLADADDELGWDVDEHGRMVQFATDVEPHTVAYDPELDDFVRGREG